jgi:hypothetical protein
VQRRAAFLDVDDGVRLDCLAVEQRQPAGYAMGYQGAGRIELRVARVFN